MQHTINIVQPVNRVIRLRFWFVTSNPNWDKHPSTIVTCSPVNSISILVIKHLPYIKLLANINAQNPIRYGTNRTGVVTVAIQIRYALS